MRATFFFLLCLTLPFLESCQRHDVSAADTRDENQRITEWRMQRLRNLTNENGWLTLVGLYWLKPGNNRFGRAADNDLVLDHPALPDHAGNFVLDASEVQFNAADNSEVTVQGRPVTQMKLVTDVKDDPTVLTLSSLRFYAIERAGRFGVRVRDVAHPARQQFQGLSYFPVEIQWRINARFEPYTPAKQVPIVNILGMIEQMPSPGALVFNKDGQTWRLDTILESPDDQELMVMFNDATNGRLSYGAGRYLTVTRPDGQHNKVALDFNQAYNPPCAFTEFATCPLPPKQNRLSLAVTAGELKYQAHH